MIETLWVHDEIVLALDEKPNMQALERAHPTQPMCAGQIERQLTGRGHAVTRTNGRRKNYPDYVADTLIIPTPNSQNKFVVS